MGSAEVTWVFIGSGNTHAEEALRLTSRQHELGDVGNSNDSPRPVSGDAPTSCLNEATSLWRPSMTLATSSDACCSRTGKTPPAEGPVDPRATFSPAARIALQNRPVQGALKAAGSSRPWVSSDVHQAYMRSPWCSSNGFARRDQETVHGSIGEASLGIRDCILNLGHGDYGSLDGPRREHRGTLGLSKSNKDV